MIAPELHPRVSTLGVSVEAVKEQLLLLGHSIPDDVIKAFLDDGLPGRLPRLSMHDGISQAISMLIASLTGAGLQ